MLSGNGGRGRLHHHGLDLDVLHRGLLGLVPGKAPVRTLDRGVCLESRKTAALCAGNDSLEGRFQDDWAGDVPNRQVAADLEGIAVGDPSASKNRGSGGRGPVDASLVGPPDYRSTAPDPSVPLNLAG